MVRARLTRWLAWRAFRALRLIAFASGAAAVELGVRLGAFDGEADC